MQKFIFISLFMLTSIVSPVYAEQNNLRETRLENRTELRNQMQENREEVRELRAENRQEIRSTIAENHANRLERRFNFYYNRLSGIATRLQTRLESLKSSGKDTNNAQLKLEEAKTKLDSAKAFGEKAVAAFRAIDPAKFEEQKTDAKAARDLANQARVAFKEALSLFKNVLKEVK